MRTSAIIMASCLSFAASAAAQGGERTSPESSSKSPLAQVRSLANALQGHTEKLADLVSIYRSMLEQRPQSRGKSPEQKKAYDEEFAKWSGAVERQLTRIEQTRTLVVDTLQALDQAAKSQPLPTSLAKDVANAHNEASAQRSAADQALKSKPKLAPKHAKSEPKNEGPAPPLDDDLDL